MSPLEISGICVRNDSELVSASLSASLVLFERRRGSCMVIRAGILSSWANMSKRKGVLSPGLKASSGYGQTGLLSASLFLSSEPELVWVLIVGKPRTKSVYLKSRVKVCVL